MKCEKCSGVMVKTATTFPVLLPEHNKTQEKVILEIYVCSGCGHTEFKAQGDSVKALKKELISGAY